VERVVEELYDKSNKRRANNIPIQHEGDMDKEVTALL